MRPTLFLVPVPLEAGMALATLPESTLRVARSTRRYLAENARSTRAFLKEIGHPLSIREIEIVEIGHSPAAGAFDDWLAAAHSAGDAVALASEAGCPAIADPGAPIVARAHAMGFIVRPMVGPSAILLALMASGLEGQRFRFHGYLPQDPPQRAARLIEIERESLAGESQAFIETPYRNGHLLEAILQHCAATTRLCVAAGLTGAGEDVRMLSIAEWRALPAAARPQLDRRPAVFALQGAGAAARHAQRQEGSRTAARNDFAKRVPSRRATRSSKSS
ncbi:MAG TPA: SAM-dependent methyltransferase [Burkholderiaceae bacterium]|nr:SAM-dependent methyltransferase [Burkholderiaceae bacterium]